MEADRCGAERKAVRPLATAPPSRLQQATGVVVSGEAFDAAALLTAPLFHSVRTISELHSERGGLSVFEASWNLLLFYFGI